MKGRSFLLQESRRFVRAVLTAAHGHAPSRAQVRYDAQLVAEVLEAEESCETCIRNLERPRRRRKPSTR